jgi:TonB-linked SusC/RagA family outer membrane protein
MATIGALLLSINLSAQQGVTVTGTVISTSDPEPLIGVNILVKGTDTGTITDFDGNFELEVPSANDTLVFSYVGYETQEVPLNGRTRLDIALAPRQQVLDEVVVVGYGVQKKSDLTGSVSMLEADELQRIPTGNVEQALQGKVAGVQVTPVSGEPGRGAVIRIRGTGTLNDASPLYVVDGMLLDDISFLNPDDIESLSVLKDASATAIYGSRGANGVIIIQTKKGTSQQTAFSFNSYYGLQEVIDPINLTNGTEFATLANEVAVNEGRQPLFDNPEAFGEGTDWQDVIFHTAPIQNYQLSANGGNENLVFNISANYFNQEGIVRGSQFERVTFRVNNEYGLADGVAFGHNIAFVRSNRDIAANVVPTAYRAEPIVPVFEEDGSFADATVRVPVSNAEASIFYQHNNEFTNRLVGNAYLDISFLNDFTFRSSFGLDHEFSQGKNFVPKFEVAPNSLQRNEESILTVRDQRNNSWLWENTLTYSHEWTNHRLNVLGGITSQEFIFEDLGGTRRNFLGETDEFFFLNAGETETQTNFNSSFDWSILSFLGRINYTFGNRYLLTASFRADGSSKFGTENRWGYFPSFALGWNIFNEPFFADQSLFSRLKIRGSWGQIGNDKIGAFAGRPTVTSNLNAVFGSTSSLFNGSSIISLANPQIKWEETTTGNIGIEFGFLDDRLYGELDFYRRVTNDILVSVPIPDYVGADNPPVINAAEVENTGIDLSINWRHRVGKVSYNVGLVGSTVNNEVLALGEGQEEIFGGGLGVGGMLGTRTVVGQPIGSFFGFKVDGVFQSQEEIDASPNRGVEVPGDLRFVDVNGDGTITTADRTMIGSPIPEYTFGFNAGVNVAGIDFLLEFNGRQGNEVVNAKKMARFGTYNFEESYLDRWTGPGSSNSEPRVTNGGHNYEMSERFVEDGSFVRLRLIQLGYTLPQHWLDNLFLRSVRFYFSGNNLITWTDYSGYTPEITSSSVIDVGIDRGVFPIAKTYTFGLNVNF